MSTRARRLLLASIAAAAATGCAGPSAAQKKQVNAFLAAAQYDQAVAQIDGARDDYGAHNAVLYALDKAAVLHVARRYQESDALLDDAEQRMDALYTRSISKAAGTFILNDNTEEYGGEVYERSLLHVLRALNHTFLLRLEDALVESRKVSSLLAEVADKYSRNPTYKDDAFAHYLAAMLFEDAGRADDARIARELSKASYDTYRAAFRTAPPRFGPVLTSDDQGELVVLHYNGVAPRKVSQTIQVAWNDALVAIRASKDAAGDSKAVDAALAASFSDAVTVAFPALVQDPYRIASSRVSVAGMSATTQVVEDIAAISHRALDDRIASIRARAIARAAVKFALAKATEEVVKRSAGSGWGMLAGMAARAGAAATEVADTRGWATLPAEIRMVRVPVPAGVHTVRIDHFDARGVPVGSDLLEGVEILSGKRTYVHVRTAL